MSCIDLSNSRFKRPIEQKIKQILPLPDTMTVMLDCVDSDNNDSQEWCDCRKSPFAICLAVVSERKSDFDDWEDTVKPYNLSEQETLNDNSRVVQLIRCVNCGNTMSPRITGYEPYDVKHSCTRCGTFTLSWEKIVETNKHSIEGAEDESV